MPRNRPTSLVAPRVEKGETIAVVAPAGPVLNEADFAAGVRLLREAGYEVRFAREVLRRRGYLAGTDAERAEDLRDLWAAPEVKALIAARGGYGCLRLLPRIEMELIRRHPKVFVGFSDISVLHAAIGGATGLVTFHGPMLTTLAKSDRASLEAFFEMIAGRHPAALRPSGLEVLKAGQARGRLLGGNLASLVHLVATPWEQSWQGAVLFLEDVSEAPYRIDRLLTHLHAAGRFAGLAGLILGSFEGCGDPEPIWQRTLELVADESFPIWANFPAGHSASNRILPLGLEVSMDSAQGLLQFACPPVLAP